MVWLERRGKDGIYFACFRFGGQRFNRSLETTDRETADDLRGRIKANIRRYELGQLDVSDDVDIPSFLLTDGRRPGKLRLPDAITLSDFFQLYFDNIPANSLEATTIDGMKIHQKHLQRHLGIAFNVRNLSKDDLQGYINTRARDKGKNGHISPMTIKKEIVTLRTVWNASAKYVEDAFPGRKLKYPKATEKLPFMSFAEVEERTRGIGEEDATELWEAVYLTVEDLDDVFKHLENNPLRFVHPMVVFTRSGFPLS